MSACSPADPLSFRALRLALRTGSVEEWSEWAERHGRLCREVAASELGKERVQSLTVSVMKKSRIKSLLPRARSRPIRRAALQSCRIRKSFAHAPLDYRAIERGLWPDL